MRRRPLHHPARRRGRFDRGRLLLSSFEQAPVAMVVLAAPDGARPPAVLDANRAFEALTGVAADGRRPSDDLGCPGSRELWSRVAAGHPVRWEGECRRPDGSPFRAEWRFRPATDAAGRLTHVVAVVRDVTEHRRELDRLQTLATRDALTGLHNRGPFEATLERLIRRAGRGWQGAVVLVDVDRFKQVNDRHGHPAGDAVLVAVAQRIAAALRPGDLLARLGGDEFGVLLEDVDPKLARRIVERIRRNVARTPVRCEACDIPVTVSAGLATIVPSTRAELVSAADAALYSAKRAGRDRVVAPGGRPRLVAVPDAGLEDRVADALAKGRLEVASSPLLDLTDGHVAGFVAEPLVPGADGGRESGADVVAAAARHGDAATLDVTLACRVLQTAGPEDGRPVLVSLSATTLAQPGCADRILESATRHRAGAQRLVLEVPEGVMVADLPLAQHWVAALRESGVRFAAGAFGLHLPSFRYLEVFPADYVSVDPSLVAAGGMTRAERSTLAAVAQMVHELGGLAIAPGVGSPDLACQLAGLGFDLAHGPVWRVPSRASAAPGVAAAGIPA